MMTEAETDELVKLTHLAMTDRAWRIHNLYLILDEEGKVVPFVPRPEQLEFWEHRHTRNFIPKARKLGISTMIVLLNGDECVWTPNLRAAIIDLKEDDAFAKLDIFRTSWTKGPEYEWSNPMMGLLWKAIHQMNPLTKDKAGELAWENGARIMASTSFTGRTPQRLHWSEAGPMSAQRPDQARKIRRGSINSAPPGAIVDIETTMEGPRVGVAYELCELARSSWRKRHLSVVDWRLHFFSWLGHPSYRLPGARPGLEETRRYFETLALRGVVATPEQQAWYESKKLEQKGEMKQQFPSTLEEALSFEGDRPRFGERSLLFLESLNSDLSPEACKWGQFVAQGDERPVWFGCDEEESWGRMWQEPQEGARYILALDCCTAEYNDLRQDMDKHAALIIRAPARGPNGELVKAAVVWAIRTDDRAALDILARRIYLATAFYGHCPVIVEVNMHMGYCAQLREAGVRNLWKRAQHIDDPGRGTGRTEYVMGWKTTPSSKPLLIERLDKVLREEEVQVWCLRIIAELRTFQQSNEALAGQHDDWVIALAMAVYAWDAATVFRLHTPMNPFIIGGKQGIAGHAVGAVRPGHQV